MRGPQTPDNSVATFSRADHANGSELLDVHGTDEVQRQKQKVRRLEIVRQWFGLQWNGELAQKAQGQQQQQQQRP